jgi:hypothetical protein
MSIMRWFVAALVAASLSPGLEARDDGPDKYLTKKEGRAVLKEPLTLREQQDGFAGPTATEWTVEPSGRWKVSRIRTEAGQEKREEVSSGMLSASELEELGKALTAQDLSSLPEKSGTAPAVNARLVQLKFGEKVATLAGTPPRRGKPVSEALRQGLAAKKQAVPGVWERFVGISEAVEKSCKGAATP